jgi:acyl-CoA thioesterase
MEKTDDFVEATALEPVGDGGWATSLRKDWALWGPAGGYLSALALRGIGEATAFPRPVSLSCQFLRVGKFEHVEIRVESLRRGKRSECLRADLIQDGRTVFTATGWAAHEGQEGMVHDYVPEIDVPQPDSLRSFEEMHPSRSPHPFIARMAQHPIDPVPESELTPRDPELESLFRFRPRATAEDPFVDAARAMLLIDTFSWLATYPAHPADGPSPWIAPNLDFYYRFHRPTMAHEWLYLKVRADLAENSLISAGGEVRDLDGRLLVSGATQLLCSRRPEQFR